MKKRILSIVLCLCMVIALLPTLNVPAKADTTPAFTGGMTPAVITEGKSTEIDVLWLFANGKAITIEKKGTGTVITADNNGTKTEIDLAALTNGLTFNKTTTTTVTGLTNSGDDGYDLSAVVICGGANGYLISSTSVTMTGGTVAGIVGGNRSGVLTGNASVSISGGTVCGLPTNDNASYADEDIITNYSTLIGGNGTGNVSGNAYLTISGGTIVGAAYVGGFGITATNISQVNNSYFTMTGGSLGTVYSGLNIQYNNSGSAYYYMNHDESTNLILSLNAISGVYYPPNGLCIKPRWWQAEL